MNTFKVERFNWKRLGRNQVSKAAKAAFEDIRKDKDCKAWAEKHQLKRVILQERDVLILEA